MMEKVPMTEAGHVDCALARIVVASRANGLRPIDGPFGDFSDADGFRAAARRAAALGCEGKWAIHPSQVEIANDTMSPSDAELVRARRILAAMADLPFSFASAVREPPCRREPSGRFP